MGCRNRGFTGEVNNTSSDALLLTTMCIIGFPVDVHVKDGSIYSGILYTASVDDDYAIVLKKAKMIKKGNREVNIVNGSLVETLIVQGEDLVQVVAKGVPLSANGILRDEDGDAIGASVYGNQFPNYEEIAPKHESKVAGNQSNVTRKGKDQLDANRSSGWEEAKYPEKIASRLQGSSSGRDGGEGIPVDNVSLEGDIKELPSNNDSSLATVKVDHQSHKMPFLEETSLSNVVPRISATDAMPTANASPQTSLGSSIGSLSPKQSSGNRPSKESKLNPGAKIFSPSLVPHTSAIPAIPAIPMPTLTYIPDPSLVVSADCGTSPFATCPSLAVKFVPYNNAVAVDGITSPQFGHPVSGQAGNRMQPVRYSGPYHQASPAFMDPNCQNVMAGRMGALVYMHPLAHDAQSAVNFSQVSACPMLAPYQVYLPKHQGSAGAQALPMCMTPPLAVAGGQHPHALPAYTPISEASFPVMGPILGPHGFFSSKLA